MVVSPEYGAIISLAFGVTRRDTSRVLRSAAALITGFTLAVIAALLLSLVARTAGSGTGWLQSTGSCRRRPPRSA